MQKVGTATQRPAAASRANESISINKLAAPGAAMSEIISKSKEGAQGASLAEKVAKR